MQPVVNVTLSSEVTYDPEDRLFPPDTEITLSTEVVYVPPPSASQPNVDITFTSTVHFEPPIITADVSGDAFFRVSSSATNELDVEPVEVPSAFTDRYNNIQRVSVFMPAPEELDRFGRPM